MADKSVIMNKISDYLHNNKEHISVFWMQNQMILDIFNQHKVSRKKFHEYFGQHIVAYFADVLVEKQAVCGCPTMNKFIDHMIERKLGVREIFLICMEFRSSMFTQLFKAKLISLDDFETMDALSYIFNQNLAGVLEYYQNKYLSILEPIQTQEVPAENFIDALTNIPNKIKFNLVLEAALAEYQNNKEPVSIIVAKIKDLEHINQIYGLEMGDVVLQEFAEQVTNSFGELGFFARIEGDTFALISKNALKNSVNLYADSILGLGRSIIFDETIALHPKFSLAIVSFVEGDTSSSVEKRMQELIKEVDEHGSDHIKNDVEILEQEEQRAELQKQFLKTCSRLYADETPLYISNFYKELPIKSEAKILEITKNSLLLSLRSIATHSLQLTSEVYMKRERPQKDVRCKVLKIDKIKNLIEVGNFDFPTASPLNRKSVHVQVEKHIPVILIHEKKHQVAYLKSISVDTIKLVLPTICSFSLNLDITLEFTLEWNGIKKSLSLRVEIIKVVRESADVFGVIFKLMLTPKEEAIIQSFVSSRQREIVLELRALDV
jgi:diguanylate cyclase (GGDEF)-like protein